MASKKPTSTVPATIDPDATYEVVLKKAVPHGKTWLRPGAARIRMSGATLLEIPQEAIDLYKEV